MLRDVGFKVALTEAGARECKRMANSEGVPLRHLEFFDEVTVLAHSAGIVGIVSMYGAYVIEYAARQPDHEMMSWEAFLAILMHEWIGLEAVTI